MNPQITWEGESDITIGFCHRNLPFPACRRSLISYFERSCRLRILQIHLIKVPLACYEFPVNSADKNVFLASREFFPLTFKPAVFLQPRVYVNECFALAEIKYFNCNRAASNSISLIASFLDRST